MNRVQQSPFSQIGAATILARFDSTSRVAAAVLLVTTAVAVTTTPAAQERQAVQRPVLSTCNYSPVAASLARSMAFYRTVAGLEFGRVSTMEPAQKVFLDIHGVSVADATFRWVIGRFAQQRCGIEPLEFGNVDRKPVESRPQDPGVTTAVIVVGDLEPVFARLKEAGAQVVSAGGNAVQLAHGAGRAVMLSDPDGHFVEVREEKTPVDASATPAQGNVTRWFARIAVRDTDESLRLYRDRLGFDVQASGFVRDKAFADLNGLRDVPVRVTRATLPDGPALELVEFKDLSRTAIQPRIQDPGATRLQLMVPDARRIGPLFRDSGGEVVSTRGEVFSLGAGRGGAPPTQVALVRDMNGVYWEVVQRAAPVSPAQVLEPIPDKLVVLTSDDAKASHYLHDEVFRAIAVRDLAKGRRLATEARRSLENHRTTKKGVSATVKL
jgi:predicted enzyme related to lactoylglutathione lyase/catechol 2,3-dioxygenase-like lactoylglutathione lyase family enzyme